MLIASSAVGDVAPTVGAWQFRDAKVERVGHTKACFPTQPGPDCVSRTNALMRLLTAEVATECEAP